ncbi:MAG: tRNA (guanosine(37)-N1)-methyltransferase TrmD [Gammaproteobacteria bacterium]|uniref:tRNA (guanine-N(1)-)-methyltransferase n=1 Tax=SAR86 cluster bacterium TaxID=2030880 RepID=A0A520MFL9_9GAMM|nr:MAG: tRNA (guanosine(37)-N1)-methyltransferase TrmD [SAR86 cluster bacterium]|tara:strand:- start:1607 stop:2335 length:729 start_codon:yes stop_codon:yes gene_type:complete
MNFNVLTIFPEIFSVLNTGVLSKELGKSFFIDCYDIRKHAVNKHGQIDSKPYGGGEGMVMMPKPLKNSLKDIPKSKAGHVIYLSPQGKKLNQTKVVELSKKKSITLICGRYEGIDQRFIDSYVDEEISIGDFVISGGEFAAVCLIDAVARNIPGAIGNKDSVLNDTFSNGLLKGHVYTRPEKFEEIEVPEVLLSGNHSKIKDWNTLNSLIQTKLRRPDLLNRVKLTKKQKKLLEEWESKDIL